MHTRQILFERVADCGDTIPCTVATSTPVMRDGMAEVLDCSPEGVDLARAPLPLITGHDTSRLAVGLVENLQPLGNKLTGTVRFATSPEAQQIRADVVAGIHRSLSVGYRHLSATAIEGGSLYRWQPHEVSITPTPADTNAGFFRSIPNPNTQGKSMEQVAVQPTANQADDLITELCTRHNLPDLAQTLRRNKATVDQVRNEVMSELATRDRLSGGHLNVRSERYAASNDRQLVINTLVARLGGKPDGDIIRSTDCTGLAIRALELAGQPVNHRDGRDAILSRSMGTSDFPVLLGNAAGRVLLQAFDKAPPVLRQVARLNNLPNFKPRTVIRLPGGASSLEKVNEHGEFTYGGVNEADNGWSLATYGRIVSLSRQALVNDDLSAFAGLLTEFGRAAARRESDELVNKLVASPTVDGSDLFSVDRNSLKTSGTSVLSLTSLIDAVLALRLQKETGGAFVNQEPGFLIVPAALEGVARQLVATNIVPNTAGNVQPYALQVVVEPRLDAHSATAWYLVSTNQAALEYGYLDGATGPQTFQEEGFNVDGLAIKCRLDFGTGWVSPLGWVKSTGS